MKKYELSLIISKRLEEYMKAEKIYLTELSERLGVSRSQICSYLNRNWESSRNNLTDLVKLSNKLNVSVDWLLGLSDNR